MSDENLNSVAENVQETGQAQSQAEHKEAPKMLDQDKVNEIYQAAFAKGKAKGSQETQAEYERRMAEMRSSAPQASNETQGAQVTEDLVNQLKSRLDEERQREMQAAEQARVEAHMSQIAKDFTSKLNSGKSQYEDFDSVTDGLDLAQFPHLVYFANEVDNTADVVYEMAKNPHKLANIQVLAQTSPELARREIKKLSQSITNNREAAEQHRDSNDPLSRTKPSAKAGADSGKMSIQDYKKIYRV